MKIFLQRKFPDRFTVHDLGYISIPIISKLSDVLGVLGDASLVRELPPDQSRHEGVLVKVTLPAHLVARQKVEVHNTNGIEKEPILYRRCKEWDAFI